MLPLLLALLHPAHARCDATAAELSEAVDRGVSAYLTDSMAVLVSSQAEARAAIDCLDELVPPKVAARFYQLEGLIAFIERREEAIKVHFQIARDLDPLLELSPEFGLPGHIVQRLWVESAGRPPFPEEPRAAPKGWEIYVDGLGAESLPDERPMVLQLTDDREVVRWSGLWVPGDDLPPRLTGNGRRVATWSLAATSAGTGLLSGALFVAALGQRSALDEDFAQIAANGAPASSQTAVSGHALRANTLGYAAQGVAGLAVGLGVSAVAVGVRW